MQPATQVYRADGAELTQADVSMDDSGSIDGKLGPNGQELFAALVVLSTNDGGLSASGTVEPEIFRRGLRIRNYRRIFSVATVRF
jgi:hypothetical protein